MLGAHDMRRYLIPLVLILAACSESPTDPGEPPATLPAIVGTYELRTVNGSTLPMTVGWYTVLSGTRTVKEDSSFTGSYRVVWVSGETADTVTLTESGDWAASEDTYALRVTQQHYARVEGEAQRWTTTRYDVPASVEGKWLASESGLYPAAEFRFWRD